MENKQTHVYVLYEGDRYEGCHVISVHTTFESAVEAAKILKANREKTSSDTKSASAEDSTYDYFQIEEVPFDI